MPVCVEAVVYSLHASGLEILTQLRHVLNAEYDPLYDGTWEAMGETLEPDEDIIDALLRGLKEECGLAFKTKSTIHGIGPDSRFKSDRGEAVTTTQPLCYLHSTGEPQKWTGPLFLVEAPPDFVPSARFSEGEVADYRWWRPSELLAQIDATPDKFMAYHRQALRLAAEKLAQEEAL